MAVQEEAGTGLALGTAGEEEEVAAEAAAEEGGAVERVQAAGTPQGLRLERGGRVAGWETFPSVCASARWGKEAGSWEPVREVLAGETEEEEMIIHWSVAQVEVRLGAEE